jgi:PPE-repeat protein
MDFGALPPEINSARMYAGPGAGPLIGAAAAWQSIAADLASTSAQFASVVGGLDGVWEGPSATAMTTAATSLLQWLTGTAEQAEQTASAARAAVEAYEKAFAATVPPPVVAANRAQLAALTATNFLGINTAAIAATEAQYAQMWAQDATAMYTYAASSSAVTSQLTPFRPAPQVTNPVANPTPAAASGVGAIPNVLQSLASPAAATSSSSTSGILGSLESLFGSFNAQDLLDSFISPAFSTPSSLLGLFTGLWIGHAAASIFQNNSGANADVTVPNYTPAAPEYYPLPSPTATAGAASSVGGLSVPPSWANPTKSTPVSAGQSPAGHSQQRYQTGIPVPPAVPVTTAGRSQQHRQRQDPEYGRIAKALPKRHPSAG